MRLRAVRRRMELQGRLPRRAELEKPLELEEAQGRSLQTFLTPRCCTRCFMHDICPIEISVGFLCNPCYLELIGQQKAVAA